MAVSYKKLWKMLIDKNMKKSDLKEQAGISSASLAKLGRGDNITTDHVMFLRSMLMAMPGKLAVDLGGTHTAAEQAERDRVRNEERKKKAHEAYEAKKKEAARITTPLEESKPSSSPRS